MKERIRILMVEPSDEDARDILDSLDREGYEVNVDRVRHASELDGVLDVGGPWNVVLCDWKLDDSDGLEVHRMLRDRDVMAPFILVTDRMGEDLAVRATRNGVTDCVFKDHLAFLAPTVERALQQERRRIRHELAEEALRQQDARYTSLFREAPVGLFRLDLIQVQRWLRRRSIDSPAGLRALLAGEPDVLIDAARRGIVVEGNRKAVELVAPLDKVEGSLERYVESGLEDFWISLLEGLVSAEPSRITGEFAVRRVGGRKMRLLLSASIPDAERDLTHVMVAASDITGQWELQTQMEEVQRMESVGRLAGGVAHDFNNALTVIQTYASFVRSSFEEDHPVVDDVDVILDSARSAARLTEQLLAFGRRQVQQLEPVSLNESVESITGILRRIIGENIEVRTELAQDLWLTEADRAQIQQILMNLAVNARDAMKTGGTLTFATRNVRVLRGMPDQPDLRPGEYARLDVADTGVGMDPATASRAFDPFFTTKPQGRGTGLGLSTVYGIVKQSGGHIWIRSRPGSGTTFEVLLPRAVARRARAQVDAGHEPTEKGGTERLLLVEDDEALRVASRRILQNRGYAVHEAPSAEEGLRLWSEASPPFDGVVTDVILPGIDGLEMARVLRGERPDLPVLFMSGYSYEQYFGVTELGGAVGFVRKPFTVDELVGAVRGTLDRGD